MEAKNNPAGSRASAITFGDDKYSTAPTPDEIWSALQAVPAYDRSLWLKMGMAVKSELGDDGFSIWDDWSRIDESYREKDARSVWKSIKTGTVTIRSLFYTAREHGWRPDQPTKPLPNPRPAPKPAKETGSYALRLWLSAHWGMVGTHPYAVKKGIQWDAGAARGKASGAVVGKSADCIIVPIRNLETGKVKGVQCINQKGEKQTFGNVKDNGLILGNTLDKALSWYVCEGWASAVSMVFHHQKGHGVCAAAFGKSNLENVAHRLDEIFSPREVVILKEVD